jgi:hypothetical protein
METLLISLILILVLILVVVTVLEIASNSLLPPREQLSFIAVVIACPPFGILFYHFFKRRRQKNNGVVPKLSVGFETKTELNESKRNLHF